MSLSLLWKMSSPTASYIGSALGNKGASTLARRLIRHATRSGDRPPHPIRGHMLIVFSSNRPGTADLLPRGPKKLFWNIDYLLDQREADLTHVLVIRNALRWEAGVARHIAPQPFSAILVRGLGANDAPGHTHLLCLCDPPAYWWPRLIDQIETLITDDRAP